MRLGVNIDHVATLRNARGGVHPSPVEAALIAEKAGADLIVAHLREDRRHIVETDIEMILEKITIPLQLEIAPTKEMLEFVIEKNIRKVCIVPEKRQELTTEGGLDVKKNYSFLQNNLQNLYRNKVDVSLFIDPNTSSIDLSYELGIKSIELHTGIFADALLVNEDRELTNISKASTYAKNKNISVRAGHGLTYDKVSKIISIKNLEELNIGHFIIGEALFDGLSNVVKKMKKLIQESL